MIDRLLAVGGGLLGGAVVAVLLWLAWRNGAAQMVRGRRTPPGRQHRVGGQEILAQNRSEGP